MARPKGLGRGLDALLAHDTSAAETASALRTLPVGALKPGRYQPRTRMDQASLEELAQSIRSQGLIQPLLARPLDGGGYEIIAGERRWRAAQLAGLEEIPVVVREIPDDATLAISLIENIQREELNPLEEAAGIQRLIDEFGMTHETAAQAVGRSRSAVTNLLRLLQLSPPVRELLMEGRIEMGHARTLVSLPAHQQRELAELVAARGLSVRETERLAAQRAHPAPERQVKAQDRDILRLQEDLSDSLGTKVTIKPGAKGRGQLLIQYPSLARLDEIIARLTGTAEQ